MTDLSVMAGRIAGVLALLAFIPYIAAILRRKARPNRATWWIWSVMGFLLGASYLAAGADRTIWVAVGYAVGPLVTAALSVKYGEGGWSRFDRGCVVGAAAGVAAWSLTGSPLAALVIFLFIDLMGALPTVRKCWRDSASEDRLTWALFLAGNTLNLFAVERWTFAIAAYPLYMFLGSGVIVALLFCRRAAPA